MVIAQCLRIVCNQIPRHSEMQSSEKKKPAHTFGINPDVGQFLTLGLQLAIVVVVFFFIGRWLDKTFETTPWLTLISAGIGITGGMVKFFRTAVMLGKRADREFEDLHKKSTRED